MERSSLSQSRSITRARDRADRRPSPNNPPSVFGGQSFGKAGPYEIVRGTVTAEIDPSDRRNIVITDIQLAPRNSGGKVMYASTFSILKPVDMTKASGILIYDSTNRGNPRFASRFPRFVLAAGGADLDYKDPGDGSICKAGHVILTSGWQGDFSIEAAGPGREGINVPIAKNPDESSVTGKAVVRFAPIRRAAVLRRFRPIRTPWPYPAPDAPRPLWTQLRRR